MPQYDVRFYKHCRTSDRLTITVEADSPEAARAKVLEWGLTGDGLTEEEEQTESLGKEEVLGSEFVGLEDEGHPYAVVEITPDQG